MRERKRIVVKVGSSLLANTERLTLRYAFMNGLMADIADLQADGYDVILTSSGSVALGLNLIGRLPHEAAVLDKQAAAACGQPLLLNAYRQVGSEHGVDIAQVLVTVDDMEERRRFLNIRNTVLRLFDRGVLPIVNENDTVATQELKVGDNDRLAAKVAQMVQADHLVILTSIDGLYDRDPDDANAQFVETVDDVSDYLAVTEGTSSLGSGGMLTKMHAANMAQNAGCSTIIGRGVTERPITSLLDGSRRHTRCLAKGTPSSNWAVWLTNRLTVMGSLCLSADAAARILGEGGPLQSEDVTSVQGQFQKGDVLHVYDDEAKEIARGIANFSADEMIVLARHTDQSAESILGYRADNTLINQENFVMLEDRHLPLEAPVDALRLVAV
ncbi:MAG: glutamate 5-kinase [Pseudomonadota bacterium]